MTKNNFGEFLYSLRKEKGMTQSELADRLDLTNKAVSKWETGETFPETAVLLPLANIFGVSVDELLRGEKNQAEKQVDTELKQEEPLNEKPMAKEHIIMLVAGVALIFAGVTAIVVMSIVELSIVLSMAVLLSCVALGAACFICMGLDKTLKDNDFKQPKLSEGRKKSFPIAAAAAVCILSPNCFIWLDGAQSSGGAAISLTVFFVLIAAAVITFIVSGILWVNFLKEHGIDPDTHRRIGSGDGESRHEKLTGAISGTIMMTATAIFLLWGFIGGGWRIAWVVFPVGGILCGIAETVLSAFKRNK